MFEETRDKERPKMRFIMEKKELLDLLVPAAAASSNKNTLPALEGLLITVEGEDISVCGYDLEKGIKTFGKIIDGEDGSIIMNAQKTVAIVRNLPDCEVEFKADNKNIVEIIGGQSQFKIHGLSSESFPSLPELGNDRSFDINQKALKDIIQSTIFAVAQTDARPILCGELFKIEETKLTVVALDNTRLAMREENFAIKNNDENFQMVIPGRALNDLMRLLEDDDEDVRVEVTKKYIVFVFENRLLFTRLLDGEYLDYKRVIPAQNKIYAKIETIPFINCVERASLIVDEKLKTPIKCEFSGNTLMVSCSTQYGRVNDMITIDKDGPDLEIGFNNKYLLDALRACKEDTIIAELSSPLMSMVIKSATPREDGSFVYLVLPCRLKD